MRGVEPRLTMYRLFGAPTAGQCASAVRAALGADWQGLPHATAVGQAVPRGAMRQVNAPRGSIVYWSGGRRGFGHVCFALGGHIEEHWPSLRYVGWSWYFGRLDTRPAVLVPPGR